MSVCLAQTLPVEEVTPRVEIRAEDHWGLAVNMAKKFACRRKGQRIIDTEEFSDALLGLVQAIKTYDPGRTPKFSTWAYVCMQNSIINHGRARKRAERLPTESLERLNRRDIVEIPDYRGKNHEIPTWVIERFFKPHPDDTKKDIRCKKVVYEYYLKECTLEDIGKKMQVTKERVRQLKTYAEKLLHTRFEQLVKDELNLGNVPPDLDE